MTNKLLAVIRHSEREKGNEKLSPRGIYLAESRIAQLSREYPAPSIVAVSDYERAENTARAMGCAITHKDPSLSKSVESWEGIPWGKPFIEIAKAYQTDQNTKNLGNLHADVYRNYASGIRENNLGLLITHDTRAEAALASLLQNRTNLEEIAQRLGSSLDYSEGYVLSFLPDNKTIIKIRTLRTDREKEAVIE